MHPDDARKPRSPVATPEQRVKAIREAMGYVMDGSSTSITFSQDDATDCYHCRFGRTELWHNSLDNLLDELVVRMSDGEPSIRDTMFDDL